jgi:RNA polymerase sigma factor (sigma-70 family)
MAETYAILEQLPEDERVALSLRFIDQMELRAVASALGVSLATVKRVLRRAENRFAAFAQRYPAVLEAIADGTRFKETP